MWDISLPTSRFYGDTDRDTDQGILTEFLSLLDRVNNYCKNFVGSVAMPEVCGLRVRLVLSVVIRKLYSSADLQ